MHELAIADSVVRIACAHAAGRKVATVELKVGHLRQVVPSALEFSFGLVAEGMGDFEISQVLGVGEATVITHLQHAKRKLGARTRAQAVALALRAGII